MRCPRCKFENMPGVTACFQCGSVLSAGPAVVNVYPPRAPGWVKPFRTVNRWLRFNSFNYRVVDGIDRLDEATRTVVGRAFWPFVYLFLSLLPGLAQMAQRRYREGLIGFGAWLLCLAVGLFGYGTSWGLFFLGLTIGIHAWLSLQGTNLWVSLKRLQTRLFAFVGLMLMVLVVYLSVASWAGRDLAGVFAVLDIPALKVVVGDYLVCRESLAARPFLSRGSLVIAAFSRIIIGDNQTSPRDTVEGMGQIVGLPGETVAINRHEFYINKRRLDPNNYPVPRWLYNYTFTAVVPDDTFFVTTEYRVSERGINAGEQTAVRMCLVPASRIRAKVFLRWLPVGRRGYLKEP